MTEIFKFELEDGTTVLVSEYGLPFARCAAQRALLTERIDGKLAFTVHQMSDRDVESFAYIVQKPNPCPFCGESMREGCAEFDQDGSTLAHSECGGCGAGVQVRTFPPEEGDDE